MNIGYKINRWTLIEILPSKNNRKQGLFLCNCGTKKSHDIREVKRGRTKSCGCIRKEKPKKIYIKKGRNLNPNAAIELYYYRYQKGAKNRELQFNLTIEEFKVLVFNNCFYCNSKPSISRFNVETSKWKNIESEIKCNGIDRLNNDLGYINENCVPCCSLCNQMKHAFSKDIFLNHINKISEYQKDKEK